MEYKRIIEIYKTYYIEFYRSLPLDARTKSTPARNQFEQEAEAFILAERLKEERRKAGLTQQQLAEKIGTKKSYISRLENGKCDIQLSTLYKIFQGLGKRVSVTIL